MIAETFYLGRDNSITLTLKSGDPPVPLTSIEMSAFTNFEIFYLNEYYDSTSNAGLFDWDTLKANGQVIIDLNNADGIAAGHDSNTELIVYSLDYPDGLVWSSFDLTISGELTPPAP